MRNLLLLLLLAGTLDSVAQSKPPKKESFLNKFRAELGANIVTRFQGKKDTAVKNSKKGAALTANIQYNLSENHAIGIMAVWSGHQEENGTEHGSILASYTINSNFVDARYSGSQPMNACAFAGIAIGATFGPTQNKTEQIPNPAKQCNMAIMPRVGITWGPFYIDAHYHWAANNKPNTYFGSSVGLYLNAASYKG